MHFADPLAIALVVLASVALVFAIPSLERTEDGAALYALLVAATALRTAVRVVGSGERG